MVGFRNSEGLTEKCIKSTRKGFGTHHKYQCLKAEMRQINVAGMDLEDLNVLLATDTSP